MNQPNKFKRKKREDTWARAQDIKNDWFCIMARVSSRQGENPKQTGIHSYSDIKRKK